MQFRSLFLASLLSAIPAVATFATHEVQGYWLNERNQITVQIEKTRDGIRAKRSDQNEWYSYQLVRDDQYRDRKGNTYYQPDDSNLEWENYNGRKRLRFRRSSSRGDRYSDDFYNHQRGQAGHYDRVDRRRNDFQRRLSGNWYNQSTGKKIQVKKKGQSIRVRSRRGGWQTFRPNRSGIYIDRHGNRYSLHRGTLEYRSHYGDLILRFKRY